MAHKRVFALAAAVLCGGTLLWWLVGQPPDGSGLDLANDGRTAAGQNASIGLDRASPGDHPGDDQNWLGPLPPVPVLTGSQRQVGDEQPAGSGDDAVADEQGDAAAELSGSQDDADQADSDESDTEEPPLSIAGWVQDDAAEPVAGIRVTAAARQLFESAGTSASTSGRSRQTATTDSEGYFDLPELADGEYAVSTQATRDYTSTTARLRAGVDSAVLVVKKTDPTRVEVYGSVQTLQGEPLAGVHVRAPGAAGATVTGGEGGYALTLRISNLNQRYDVRFTKPKYKPEILGLDATAIQDGAQVRLDATLEPIDSMAQVEGTVTDPDGEAVPGARVQFSSANLGLGYTTRTDAAGDFALAEVAVGDDYRLWVRPRSDYQEHVEDGIAVDTGGLYLPVTVEPLGTGTLHGRLVSIDGAPVPNFSLWVRASSPSAQLYQLVTSDQGGHFSVPDLPEGQVSFSTRAAPDHRISGLYFSPEDQGTVELPLDVGAHEAVGFVLDANGEPVAGAQVQLTASIVAGGVQSRSRRSTVTDAAGTFLFSQLGLGWHQITVDANGYGPARVDHYVGSGEEPTVQLREDQS